MSKVNRALELKAIHLIKFGPDIIEGSLTNININS